MSIQYANDAKSYLASAVEAVDTTIEVASAELLPVLAAGDEMYLTIADNLNAALKTRLDRKSVVSLGRIP